MRWIKLRLDQILRPDPTLAHFNRYGIWTKIHLGRASSFNFVRKLVIYGSINAYRMANLRAWLDIIIIIISIKPQFYV